MVRKTRSSEARVMTSMGKGNNDPSSKLKAALPTELRKYVYYINNNN